MAEPEVCPDCGGSGWIVAPDGGAGVARPCPCKQRERVPRLLDAAGIPPRYQGCTLANFNVAGPVGKSQLLAARALCQRYVDEFLDASGRPRETGLLFLGPPGCGKTHLAAALLRELIQRYGVRGRFVDFTTLIHEIQSTFDPGSAESKHAILDPVIEAELLVLDELGAQKPSAWVNDILYLVMNARYTRRAPTLFTTNYRLGDAPTQNLDRGAGPSGYELLAHRIPPMLVSRLGEMAQPVVLDAVADFRREVQMPAKRI